MNTTYTLNMSKQVKSHFDGLLMQASHIDEHMVITDIEELLTKHQKAAHSQHIAQRIELLNDMLAMLVNKQWQLTTEHKHNILSALAYFKNNDDVIPDEIPVIGLLDDCIVIDMVAEKVTDELRQYHDFSKTVKNYALEGDNNQVEQWRIIQKQELFSRIRHRRRRKFNSAR